MSTVISEVHDLPALDGQVVAVIGTYLAVDTSPYAYVSTGPDGKLKKVYVIGEVSLADKTTIMLGIRPPEELKACDEKKVVIIGRLVASPARGEGIMAQPAPSPWLVDIESVDVRPG